MTDIVERLNEPCPCSYCDGDAANQRDEAKAEIERLREALRHYVRECDCNGGTYYEDDHITGKTLVKDCLKCEPARAALEGKE